MKAIGGYPELELRDNGHYHVNAIFLNTARNCLEYILRARKYKKVYIPYYTCEVMLEPFYKLGVEYKFYEIDLNFEPINAPIIKSDEGFLYTNYFGLKKDCITHLAQCYSNHLIIDNAQAFFDMPIEGIDTFYSARKFFGVPDGAYLYTEQKLDIPIEQDYSYTRMAHLLKRIDLSPEDGYKDFQEVEESLVNSSIKKMSKLTAAILSNVDYNFIASKRRQNFQVLNEKLHSLNELNLKMDDKAVPLAYPWLSTNSELRNELISNRIFVPVYWRNISDWCSKDMLEYKLYQNLLPLPVDQRIENNWYELLKFINNND